MKHIYTIVSILLFSSCASRKQKAIDFFTKNPDHFAALCANAFPIKEQIIRGQEIIKMDTIQILGSIIPCPTPSSNIKPVYVRCPDDKMIIKKIVKTDTLIRENTARVSHLSDQLSRANHDRDRYQRRTHYMGYLIAVLFLCISIRYMYLKFI